jgi:hypothetical protein
MTNSHTLMSGVPLVENPLFPSFVDSLNFDPETKRVAMDLHDKGYAVIEFPDAEFGAVAERIKQTLACQFDFDGWRQHGWPKNAGLRVQDAWQNCADVRRLAINEHIQTLLSVLYGRRAFPFQTLNFPVGTQQHYHTDSVHFSSVPERFMCGVWVALEDIDEEAGPLIYYPGTHRLPIFVNEHLSVTALDSAGAYDNYARFETLWRALVDGLGLKPERFCVRKGEALIWAANLLHGGDRHHNPAHTRWSQVTHYFFDDCAYHTPLLSDPFYGSISFRTGITNISTGRPVPNRYVDRDIPIKFISTVARERSSPKSLLPSDFSPALYLAANPDVEAAGVDPVAHYLEFGALESRKLKPESGRRAMSERVTRVVERLRGKLRFGTRLLAFIPSLAILVSIRAFAVNVPYRDEWDLVPFAIRLYQRTLTFGDLWSQSNEHRMAAVKLIMAPLILLTDFDVTAQMYAGFALQFLAFIFLWLVLDLTLRTSHQSLVAPLGLVIGFLMFSPAQEETWLIGQASLQWHLCNLTVAATMWVFTRWLQRWFALPIAFFLACAGMLAIASGIVLWGMVFIAIVTQSLVQGTRPRRKWLLAWAIGAFALSVGYFAGFQTTSVAPNVFFFLTEPLKFIGFVLVYLGWPLAQGGSVLVAGVVGLGGLVCLAAGVYGACQNGSSARPILPWLWLSIYALLVALVTAVGRVESGVVMATATRYTAGALLFWMGLAVIAAVALRTVASERPLLIRGLRLSILVLLTVGFVNYVRLYHNGYRAFVKSEKDRTLGLVEVYNYNTPHDGALTLLYPYPERARDYARQLERYGLGPFSGRMSAEQRRLANVLTVAEKIVSGQGALDVVECGIIGGWASDREQPDVPVKVDISDGEVRLQTLTANQFRWDLVDAGIGNGSHGFSYAPPTELKDGRARLIRATISGSDIELTGSAKPLVCK